MNKDLIDLMVYQILEEFMNKNEFGVYEINTFKTLIEQLKKIGVYLEISKNNYPIQYIFNVHKYADDREDELEGKNERILDIENIIEEGKIEKTENGCTIYKTRKLAIIKGKAYIGNKPSKDYVKNVKYIPIFSKMWDCKIDGGDGEGFYYKELEGKIIYDGKIYSKVEAKHYLDVVNDDGAVKLKIKLVK